MLPSQPKITHDMVFNLKYDDDYDDDNVGKHKLCSDGDDMHWDRPVLMIVFECSDIDSAAYYVAKSAQCPFASNIVASVLVQESVYEAFVTRVRAQFRPLAPRDAHHPSFRNAMDIAKRLKAKTIVASEHVAAANMSPTLVCDVVQSYFGYGPSGTVSLQTFRTAREVPTLCAKETIAFHNISLWHSNLGACYELAENVATAVVYLNCYSVPLEPIDSYFQAGRMHVAVVDNYHYETLKLQNTLKLIVFHIGSIFA